MHWINWIIFSWKEIDSCVDWGLARDTQHMYFRLIYNWTWTAKNANKKTAELKQQQKRSIHVHTFGGNRLTNCILIYGFRKIIECTKEKWDEIRHLNGRLTFIFAWKRSAWNNDYVYCFTFKELANISLSFLCHSFSTCWFYSFELL